MKNIYILPTDKPSRLHYSKIKSNGQISYKLVLKKEFSKCNDGLLSGQRHIYITSDEEIKELDKSLLILEEFEPMILTHYEPVEEGYIGKKIILTTDIDLIKDGVQAIDDEFLEWFVKNPSCEWVVVEKKMLCNYCGEENCDNLRCRGYIDSVWYEIIIPKEEPKTKCYCGHTTYCDCGVDVDFEIKQETLEEAADKTLQDEINYWYEKTGSLTSEDIVRRAYSLGITTGAKWQEERMYNEEEVLELLNKREDYINSEDNIFEYQDAKKWFEKFKKK